MKLLKNYFIYAILLSSCIIVSCGDDDDDDDVPPEENEEEIITDVNLTFTPADGGTAVTASAQDPDGEGPLDLEVVEDIVLSTSTTYTLTLEILNAEDPNNVEDITEEIEEEADEHMFFFAWTNDIFSDPEGNGNADSRDGSVNYNDEDSAGLPLGLSTTWTTGDAASGTFRVVLKHQPDVKSATSTINDGGTDIDITWDADIE